MKFVKRISFLSCLIPLLLSSCEIIPIGSSQPLASKMMGRWEWVRTETPSKTLTPETEGYGEDLSFSNNGDFDFTVIYRNDTLFLPLIETRRKNVEVNYEEQTLIIPYRSGGYIKFLLLIDQNNIVQEIERSELMDVYTESADTIRHVYVRSDLPAREYKR